MTDATCDVRRCDKPIVHSFFEMNPDLSITEQVHLCDRHARLLCDLDDDLDEEGGK